MILQDTPMAPNLNSIIAGFAAVVGLFILREIKKVYEWNLRNEGMPALVHELKAAVDSLVLRLNRHCNDEEDWQREVKQQFSNTEDSAALVAKMAHDAVLSSEARLTGQIKELSVKVDTLNDRRHKPR